ncbi:MAG TPA: CDP-glycerol glycerophosphotransferase family protein [Vicinamibacteria bacterium]|nr:CDP-glycerol glycerophosphotransferase family protein [Vicinamibacteria bacterium]
MTLLVCAGREAAEAVLPGARILAWDEAAAQALASARVPCDTLASLLGSEACAEAFAAAIPWTKAFGRRPLLEGRSLLQLLSWKGVPLFYFAELYLHHSTASPGFVRAIELFHRVLEKVAPAEVEAAGLSPEETLLLQRTCTARGVLFHGVATAPSRRSVLRVSLESRWNNLKTALSAVKAALAKRPALPPADGRTTVLFLSHAAFWKSRREAATGDEQEYEHYFDTLLPAVAAQARLRPLVLAVGPRAAFRRRGVRDRTLEWLRLPPEAGPYVHVNRFTSWRVSSEVRRATRQVRTLWRSLRRSPAAHEAFSHRGVAFLDLAQRDLAATLLLQLPWAVRSYEEMSAALEATRPGLVLLYAESSGWGRAAVAACRAQGVPTLALQHGILYPGYYSYLHGKDETDCPRPDRTAVFGEAAKRFLVEQGGYAPESLIVTGSPKFDALLALARGFDREALRRGLGVAPGEKLLLVASRFRAIRETHQSIGSAFPALVAAAAALPGVHLLVKPHPAESGDPYERAIRAAGATRARVLSPRTDLLELLAAMDALVTVESLSAVEALVVGRPVLVLNLPTNLDEMVEQGMALGVARGVDPTDTLRRLLYDQATARSLAEARERYLGDVAHGVDGQATARILELVSKGIV